MSAYSLLPLSTAIYIICLAFFVYFNNKKSILNRLLAWLSVSLFIWLIGYAIMYSVDSESLAIKLARFLYIGVIFIPITDHHFIMRFLNKKKQNGIIIFSYVIGTIFVFLCLFNNNFIQGVYHFFWGYQTKVGYLHNFFLIFFFILIIRSWHYVYIEYKINTKKKTEDELKRIKYVFWAFFLGNLGAIDFIPDYGIGIYPVGSINIVIFVSVMAYAILRHQLLDISVIIKKTLVYSSLVTIITILYFIIILLLENVFRIFIGYYSIPITIAVIALFSLIFIPLKNKIQKVIDKYFFKGSIDQIDEEKRRLESELQRSERLKTVSTLAAGMAHEIKNPLTSIKTFVEYLDKKYADPDYRAKFKDIIPKEIDKISNIISQLLDYSNTEKSKLKQCNIHSIIDYILALYSNELIKDNISITKLYQAHCPTVMGDENRLKQAFINIILNSKEAIKKEGEITIKTETDKGFIKICIEDNGVGIPKDKLKNIFNPFYTTKEQGTGLGLFIVHQIIENNKGKISVTSEAGKGSEVLVVFRSA